MIGLGSAFGSMVQGMMQGNQANRQNQQAERQQQEFDMLKTQFEQAQKEKLKQDTFKAIYAAKKFGDWSELKQVAPKYEGESLRQLESSEVALPTGDGKTYTINPSTRAKFEAQTGMKLPEGEEAAIKYLRDNVGMIKDERTGVESFVTPEQLGAGVGPGYRMFERKKDLEEAVIAAKLLDKQKAASDIDQFSQLEARVVKNGFDSLSDIEKAKYRTLGTKLKMTSANAKQDLLNPKSTHYQTVEQASKGKPVSKEAIRDAVRVQTLSGMDYKDEVNLNKALGAYGNLARVSNELTTALNKEDGELRGVVNKYKGEAIKMASNAQFNEMNAKDQEKYLRSMMSTNKAMIAVMKVLKEQSGAAVSEEEFARVLNASLGGDIKNLNAQTISKAIQNYSREYGESVRKDIDAVPDRFAGTKASAYDRWNRASEGTSFTPEVSTETPTSGTKTSSEVAGDVPMNKVQEAINLMTGGDDNKPEEESPGLWDSAKKAVGEAIFGDPNEKVATKKQEVYGVPKAEAEPVKQPNGNIGSGSGTKTTPNTKAATVAQDKKIANPYITVSPPPATSKVASRVYKETGKAETPQKAYDIVTAEIDKLDPSDPEYAILLDYQNELVDAIMLQ